MKPLIATLGILAALAVGLYVLVSGLEGNGRREALARAFTDRGVQVEVRLYRFADEATARKVMKLQGLFEDNDDVQTVTTNLDVSPEVAAKLAAE